MPEARSSRSVDASRSRQGEESWRKRNSSHAIDARSAGVEEDGLDLDLLPAADSADCRGSRRGQSGLGEPETDVREAAAAAEDIGSSSFSVSVAAAASRCSGACSSSAGSAAASSASTAATAPPRLLPALRRLPPGRQPGGIRARAGVRRCGDGGRLVIRKGRGRLLSLLSSLSGRCNFRNEKNPKLKSTFLFSFFVLQQWENDEKLFVHV